MAVPPYQLKQKPTDTWSIREKLALASSVERTRDQNWVSVSRQIKPFAETNRPQDWFSQKNCALQYGALLEDVEHPKRKRGEEIATPGSIIVKNLVQERIQELEKLLKEGREKHEKFQRELTQLNDSQLDEAKIDAMVDEVNKHVESEIRREEEYEKWLKERELEAERQRQLRLQMLAMKTKKQVRTISDASDSMHSDDSNLIAAPESPLPPPPSSLLTTLLRSPTQSPNQSPRTSHGSLPVSAVQSVSLQRLSTDSQNSGSTTPVSTPTGVSSSSQAPTLSKLLEIPPATSSPAPVTATSAGFEDKTTLKLPFETTIKQEVVVEDKVKREPTFQDTLSAIEDVTNQLQEQQNMPQLDPSIARAVEAVPEVDVRDENIISVIEQLQEDMQRKEEEEQRKQLMAMQQLQEVGPSSVPDANMPAVAQAESQQPSLVEERVPFQSFEAPANAAKTATFLKQASREPSPSSVAKSQQVLPPPQQPSAQQQPAQQQQQQQQQPSQLQQPQASPQQQQQQAQQPPQQQQQQTSQQQQFQTPQVNDQLPQESQNSQPQPQRQQQSQQLKVQPEADKPQQQQQQQQQEEQPSKMQQPQQQLPPPPPPPPLPPPPQQQQQQQQQPQTQPQATVDDQQQQSQTGEVQQEQQPKLQPSAVQQVISLPRQTVTKVSVVPGKATEKRPKEVKERDSKQNLKVEQKSPIVSPKPSTPQKTAKAPASAAKPNELPPSSIKYQAAKAQQTTEVSKGKEEDKAEKKDEAPATVKSGSAERTETRKTSSAFTTDEASGQDCHEPPIYEEHVASNTEIESDAFLQNTKDDLPEQDEMIEEEVSEEEIAHDQDELDIKNTAALESQVAVPAVKTPKEPTPDKERDVDRERDQKIWKKSALLVWRTAANHSNANVFMNPVPEDMAPGYDDIVFKPMDLATIRRNIENGVIKTTMELLRDMMLMFQNAIMYNSADHDVYHMALEMQDDVVKQIEELMANEASERSGGAHPPEGAKRPARHRHSDSDISSKKPRRSTGFGFK